MRGGIRRRERVGWSSIVFLAGFQQGTRQRNKRRAASAFFAPSFRAFEGRNRPGRKRASRLVLGRLFCWLLTRRATGEQRTRCRRAESRYARRNKADCRSGLVLDRLFGWLSTRHATEEQKKAAVGLFRPVFSRLFALPNSEQLLIFWLPMCHTGRARPVTCLCLCG